MIQIDWKDIYSITNFFIFFYINYVLLNFLLIKESWKIYHSFHKKSAAVFNIDINKKCFLNEDLSNGCWK